MASLLNRNWVFGSGARLDFSTALAPPSTALPTPSSGTAIGLAGWREGCASISDAGGQLVLYTDGNTVWDGANTVVASGLLGDRSCTQSAIIVPDPGHLRRYYVFTTGERLTNNHVNGIRIDTGTSPWAVTPLSSVLTLPATGSPTEKLTAIQHANCRDFWVLTVVQDTGDPPNQNLLRVFLVTPSGVQHISPDLPMNAHVEDIGYLKGSPDGKRIALANFLDHTVLVYPFDHSTGTIDPSQLVTITVPPIKKHDRLPYGVEFSPSGNLLYFSVVDNPPGDPQAAGYVYQYDLIAGTLFSAPAWIHQNADQAEYALGALQRGMDDRIYIAQDGEDRLGVIENPDVPGTGCNLTFGALTLTPGSRCWMGLPNLIPNPCECACTCEEGNCDEAVEHANQTLDARADEKHFTIHASGQPAVGRCRPAFEQRELAPLFSLHWGDGANDRFESHDTEVVYIRVHNPWRNLVYRGLKIFNIRITPNQALPDGENALQLVPAEIVCFDGIQPCSHVSRDFAFHIQNAVPQGYQITFEWCVEEIAIVTAGTGRAAFDIEVVAS
jgi:hypothetical protein